MERASWEPSGHREHHMVRVRHKQSHEQKDEPSLVGHLKKEMERGELKRRGKGQGKGIDAHMEPASEK